MSGNKTEKPTDKKKKDAAKKGQIFKSRDLTTSCLIIIGLTYLVNIDTVMEMMLLWISVIGDEKYDVGAYVISIFSMALKLFLPFLFVCAFSSVLISLLQTGFTLATKALKIDFTAVSPAKGFKKIFSWRTIRDAIKSVLYLFCFIISAYILIDVKGSEFFRLVYSGSSGVLYFLGEVVSYYILIFTCCIFLVLILDALSEFAIHIKDLKMEKREVKNEHKEQDGNPEIKSRRRMLHMEILSAQDKHNVENSQVIIANPTHITVGIYFNPEIVPIPFISLIETNQKALAIRKYAIQVGVPVIEDISLARRLYKTHKQYSFVSLEEVENILRLLVWLQQVDSHWREV